MREKLIELHSVLCRSIYAEYDEAQRAPVIDLLKTAENLIANGVTVQDSKVVEIDQFKLPIDDAILILKEEHKQRVDGYTTHLSYGGKGDPAEEAHLDALEMAIAALEWQKRQMH